MTEYLISLNKTVVRFWSLIVEMDQRQIYEDADKCMTESTPVMRSIQLKRDMFKVVGMIAKGQHW